MELILDYGQAVLNVFSIGEILSCGLHTGIVILLFILLRRITATRKQINQIQEKVEEYLNSIVEAEEQSLQEQETVLRKKQQEQQNKLINSVLEEIFS